MAVSIRDVSFHYGARAALSALTLDIPSGRIFALLGPNGGGKTTLFRILTTYFPLQSGEVQVLGLDLRQQTMAVRARIGVVFQHPSLDGKLTVAENLKHHGRLYGMTGQSIRARSAAMLGRLGLSERSRDRVETLSGGLARRVELAKGLMHGPELLILDEPSTGLDPGARRDLWQYLASLKEEGVTVLVTTHLMEEAERADHIAILDHGKLVAFGSPETLRAEIGGEIITIETMAPSELARTIKEELQIEPEIVDQKLRVEVTEGYGLVERLARLGGARIQSIAIARPTLEDVFIKKTGHRFWSEAE
jgi:ABC-2 type transport system ATP-binding protein